MSDGPAPLVLLDRDGVINRDSAEYIKSVAEWQPLPGALEAIAELTGAGFSVAVVTNQSGIGRGLFDEAMLDSIHVRMREAVERAGGRLVGVYYCPHLPNAGCSCRKPEPALLLRAIDEHGGGRTAVAYVGDKLSDAQAAMAAGVQPIMVGDGGREACRSGAPAAASPWYADLATAARALIAEFGPAQ